MNIWAKVLQAPLYLLVIAAFIASIYLAATGQYSIRWGTPVLFAIIIALYIWGVWMEKKK